MNSKAICFGLERGLQLNPAISQFPTRDGGVLPPLLAEILLVKTGSVKDVDPDLVLWLYGSELQLTDLGGLSRLYRGL